MLMTRNRKQVDEAFKQYLDWREQLLMCDLAYRSWVGSASSSDSAIAFARYAAALDREEQAAGRYQTALNESR